MLAALAHVFKRKIFAKVAAHVRRFEKIAVERVRAACAAAAA